MADFYPAEAPADLAGIHVERGDELEVVLAELWKIGERLTETPHADDGHLPRPREAEDAAQLQSQALNRVAAAARAKAAEVGEVLTNLKGGDLCLCRQAVRRGTRLPCLLEVGEHAQVGHQSADGGRRDSSGHQRGKLAI